MSDVSLQTCGCGGSCDYTLALQPPRRGEMVNAMADKVTEANDCEVVD